MLVGLIQSLFFFSICTITQPMNTKQRGIVRSMLNKNIVNEIVETPKTTRTIIQPLPEKKLHRSLIKANHIEQLRKNKKSEQMLTNYEKIASHMPDDLSILKPDTKKAYTSINNSIKKIACEGDFDAQKLFTEKCTQRLCPLFKDLEFLTEKSIKRTFPFFSAPESFIKIKNKSCVPALELLNFTTTLSNNNILITTTDDNKEDLIKLREITDPATSYIIQATLYLQAITDAKRKTRFSILFDQSCPQNPEIEAMCQFLINYGNATMSAEDVVKKFILTIKSQKNIPHILSEIAHTPLCSQIITKLNNVTLEKNDPLLPDLHYFLAEFYYKRKNYTQANNFYLKNKLSYLKEKKINLNAFNAYLATSQSFCKRDINYLSSRAGNISIQLKRLNKTDPKLSYGVGLLTQALMNSNFTMNVLKKIDIIINGLKHLEYAQKNGLWDNETIKKIATLCSELHTTLSTIYETNNNAHKSLKQIIFAIEHHLQNSNSNQDRAVLTILTQAETENSELYKQYAQWTATILNLIYNPHKQLYNDKHRDYSTLPQYASYNLCSQLLPYLEQAYTTNKKNKNEIAYLLALLYQQTGDYLKAYNYKRILPQSTPHAMLLNKGIFSLNDTNDTQLIFHALDLLETEKQYPKNPEIKAMCQFFLNEESAQSFIEKVKSQEEISPILHRIAQDTLCSAILRKLNKVILKNNDPLLPHLNCVLAELYYYSKDYKQAHFFYSLFIAHEPSYSNNKTIKLHAFTAYIASAKSFCQQSINYLSSLTGNISNQLKQLNKTDPKLSYGVGLLTQALINSNSTMNMLEKTDIIFNGLEHLAYAQKNGIWNEKSLKTITQINIELHTTLSTIYADKNDNVASLKQIRHVLEYRSQHSNNTQDGKVLTILAQAEKNNPDLYIKHAPWTKIIVDFIDNKHNHLSKQKNHSLLSQFASSDLCAELLPYCEQSYETSKQASNDIICLMALNHKNNGDDDKAYDYINKLSQPISNAALLLKAQIYTAAKKPFPCTELKTVLTLFINNKNPSRDEQDTVVSLMKSSNNFFIQAKNYILVLKLITKLTELPNMPAIAIELASYITDDLFDTNNSYCKQWQKGLDDCQFYRKIQDPSLYDGNTNSAAGFLFTKKESVPNYEKAVSHFTAAVDSKELLPKIADIIQKYCVILYCDWAATMTHDKKECLRLFDKAIQYDMTGETQYKKAVFILQNSDDLDLINHALELLEKNITTNSSEKMLSQLKLAQAYCNYSTDPARLPIIKQLIPLDIRKAIDYLKEHNNKEELLKPLVSIFAGESVYINSHIAKEYTDLEKALEYINILINNEKNNIDYLSHRMQLYTQLNKTKEALQDIELMFNAQELSNTRGITKEKLLLAKIKILLSSTLDNDIYDQILECFKQLRLYNEKNIMAFNTQPLIQERTRHFVTKNIMTDDAIEWCCFVSADPLIAAEIAYPLDLPTTPEQKELALYLLAAAKMGNVNAQLSLLPYLNAINYTNQDIKYFTDTLHYAHKALLNPISSEKKAQRTILVKFLHELTEKGFALAYYILCDYYKNNTEQFEKTMLLFSKAEKQHHNLNDTTDTIEVIYGSCKDTLWKYVDRYIKNQKKGSLNDALATFTLGSMYLYSDKKDLLAAGTFYLKISLTPLCNKFKLSNYQDSTHTLLGNAYYKSALLAKKENTKTVNLNLLRESAQVGCLPAAYKLAEIYIQQHKDGKKDISVSIDDFVPLLKKDRDNPHSSALLQKYLSIQDPIKQVPIKQVPIKKAVPIINKKHNPVPLNVKATENEIISVKERMPLITKHANEKGIIKYIHHKEESVSYNSALKLNGQGKKKEAADLLQKAINEEKHPSACIMLALSYLTGELTAKDYKLSKELLNQAFSYGLIIKAHNNSAKQFHNISFLDILFYYIESLATVAHPSAIKSNLLATIKKTLETNGFNLTTFRAIFKKITGINIPEWSTEKEKTLEPITPPDHKKNMIKYPDYKETSPDFFDALQAYQQEKLEKALISMNNFATKEHHPTACIVLAMSYLQGTGVEKNNITSEKFLHDALKYGLIKKQFCNNDFLNTLCDYIDLLLITTPNLFPIKQQLLAIIKEALITKGIDIAAFCKVVQEKTKINLPLYPEWSTEKEKTLEKNSIVFFDIEQVCPQEAISKLMNSIVQEKAETNLSLHPEDSTKKEKTLEPITPSSYKKEMINCPDYKKTSTAFLDAKQAYQQGDIPKAVKLMTHAATKEQHPVAYIILASNYLKGDGVKKTYSLSKMFLMNALTHGLTTKQFCNNDFVNALCGYIKELLTKTHPRLSKQYLLSIIKKMLEQKDINLTKFCEIVRKEIEIDLLSVPEWRTNENHNKAMRILDTLKNSMIKSQNSKEDCNSFVIALEEYQTKSTTVQSDLIKNIAAKYPTSSIQLALTFLIGTVVDINYDVSKNFLIQSLSHGLIEKQFSNTVFLETISDYIEILITTQKHTPIKQQLLSIIKKALETNGINLTTFRTIFKEITDIDLLSTLGWNK